MVLFACQFRTGYGKISYLTDRIDAGEQVGMKDIYQWCQGHGIKYNTQFVYRKDFL